MAVKLLWQFLGVLADRLDQTSKDLAGAREELAAEDITDAIFPEIEEPLPAFDDPLPAPAAPPPAPAAPPPEHGS